MRVVWTKRARLDSLNYAEVIAEDDPAAAAGWLDEAWRQADDLERFPRMGRIVPEFGREDLRELLIHSHRLIYRIRQEQVEIVRVWHGSRPLYGADASDDPGG